MKQTAADLEALDERVSEALWYENYGDNSRSSQLAKTWSVEDRCEEAGYPLDEED